MRGEAIFFEFDTARSAVLARDTLEELGYETGYHFELNRPLLHIQVDRNELTSALEIAQAHGGRMVEHSHGIREEKAFSMAYTGLNEGYIPIPAHIVNEDWADADADAAVRSDQLALDQRGELEPGNGAERLDPSGDDYNHFDAGIRL